MTRAIAGWLSVETLYGGGVLGLDEKGRCAIPLDGRITIGPHPACDLVVQRAMIGGQRSCDVIADDEGTCRVRHLGHTLGIWVGDRRIHAGDPEAELKDGVVIQLESATNATVRFRFTEYPLGIWDGG